MSEGRPSDGKSNPEVMARLVLSVNPDFQRPSGVHLPLSINFAEFLTPPAARLTDEEIVQRFDHNVKTKYYEQLELFYNLLGNVISWEAKGPRVVAALIDLIEADSTIPSDALFYVRPFGQPVKKSELREIDCICILSFVFGVWHYIITKIRDNTVGADTISYFLDSSGEIRSVRKFVSKIGIETAKKISTSVAPQNVNGKITATQSLKK